MNWTPIGLRYYAPAGQLRGMVSSYYVFHIDLPEFADLLRADLPQLRFILSGRAAYHFGNGRVVPTPEASLVGPTFGSYRIVGSGPLLVFGIGLLPAGWASLMRVDASEFADQVTDAAAVLGNLIAKALERLQEAPTAQDMVEIADSLLSAIMAGAPEPPLWFARLTDQWLTSSPSPAVDHLIANAGMSGRQVERLTRRVYGAPPKLLGRKYRALKAAAALAKGDTHWSEVVGDAFSDQSHFIREFRQFLGITPRQLIANPPPVTRLTLERRRISAALPELTRIT